MEQPEKVKIHSVCLRCCSVVRLLLIVLFVHRAEITSSSRPTVKNEDELRLALNLGERHSKLGGVRLSSHGSQPSAAQQSQSPDFSTPMHVHAHVYAHSHAHAHRSIALSQAAMLPGSVISAADAYDRGSSANSNGTPSPLPQLYVAPSLARPLSSRLAFAASPGPSAAAVTSPLRALPLSQGLPVFVAAPAPVRGITNALSTERSDLQSASDSVKPALSA